MEQKDSKIFNKTTLKNVESYCKLNNIEDINVFIKKCFDTGFNIEKYGLLGKTPNDGEKHLKTVEVEEKHVIKEVIVEKRVEVPVEVVKEIFVEKEVIKEVPIEKIVTKIEYITNNSDQDNNKVKMLQTTIQNLTSEVRELKKKNEELEKKLLDTPKQVGNIQAKFYGSSNLNDDLYK
jgi:hypothetical protein